MIAIGISLICAVLCFSLFTLSIDISAINRIVIQTPVALFENAIPLIDYDKSELLYFDKILLENNINRYFDDSLKNYTKETEILFYYYNQDDDSYCVLDKCDAVEITIKATIVFSYIYERTMFYEIKDMNNGF